MKLPYRSQFNSLIRTGLVFLIFANAARFLLHPIAKLPESLADGFTGFFYGVAFGLMLWGIVRNHRQCKTLAS